MATSAHSDLHPARKNTKSAVKAYRDWIADDALPIWSSRGFDMSSGRFRERLDLLGDPLDVPHRAMVQARQIYVFCHAAIMGWHADGAALAEIAMATLLRESCHETADDASFAFSVGRDGRPISAVRDAYTHAFMLLALAWLYRLNGDSNLLGIADKTCAFIDARLVDQAHGGLMESWPAADLAKRQNPLMHLLEAYIFLEQAAPGRGYMERAHKLIGLFADRLFDNRAGILREHFAQNWSPHPDGAKAQIFEPGHHFEWVWLLGEYSRLTSKDVSEWTMRLHETACSHGISPAGLVYDEVDVSFQVLKPSHRIWPHTEGMKAAVTRHAQGHDGAEQMANRMAQALIDSFLGQPFAGGWIDHIASSGEPLVDYVPASSLYHLFLAGSEASTAFGANLSDRASIASPC